jgi:hypothetical protein
VIAVVVAVVVVVAWVGWAVYAGTENGASAGIGVLISWPLLIGIAALLVAPLVIGAMALFRRDSGSPAIAGGGARESADDERRMAEPTRPQPARRRSRP